MGLVASLAVEGRVLDGPASSPALLASASPSDVSLLGCPRHANSAIMASLVPVGRPAPSTLASRKASLLAGEAEAVALLVASRTGVVLTAASPPTDDPGAVATAFA